MSRFRSSFPAFSPVCLAIFITEPGNITLYSYEIFGICNSVATELKNWSDACC